VPDSQQLILNEDTAFYQLVICAVLLLILPVICLNLVLPWLIFAVLAWVVGVWSLIEFVLRRYYSVYIENGEIILYNLFNLKAKRFPVQEFDKVALRTKEQIAPGYYFFSMYFKNGSRHTFIVESNAVKFKDSVKIYNYDYEIVAYVDGLVRSFIAGSWTGSPAPFRNKKRWG
jgi:hypothetical protein